MIRIFSGHGSSLLPLIPGIGIRFLLHKALEHIWGTKVFLGLRCDLASLPPIRPAKFKITMTPCDGTSFSGFFEEYDRVKDMDRVDVILRMMMCSAGVRTLYVAMAPDGSPAYVQWLIGPKDQDLLHTHQPGRYPKVAPDEMLLEGSYTFFLSRRTGVMSDGMAQLLRIAKASGAHSVITYVSADNTAALRGCANVGFTLDHARKNIRRLGFTQSIVQPIDEYACRMWLSATAAHKSA